VDEGVERVLGRGRFPGSRREPLGAQPPIEKAHAEEAEEEAVDEGEGEGPPFA